MFAHIVEWFARLNRQRAYNEAGPVALSFADIKAWSDMMGIDIAAHELVLLTDLDNLFREQVLQMRKRKIKKKG